MEEDYDYLIVVLPESGQHGEHKAASLLALEAVNALPSGKRRPVVVGGTNLVTYTGMPGYPVADAPSNYSFSFDRTQPLGRNNYMVIASWSIAEHKVRILSRRLLYSLSEDPRMSPTVPHREQPAASRVLLVLWHQRSRSIPRDRILFQHPWTIHTISRVPPLLLIT